MTTVVGGVYLERCVEPYWDDVYGSGGRAAAALGDVPGLRLLTYRATPLLDGLANLEAAFGLVIEGPEVRQPISFDYVHSLAVPRIEPRPDAIRALPAIEAIDDVVLRFGMLEGTARVKADVAVYDPQSAFDPRPFAENGSSAGRLALILNRLEAGCLTREREPHAMVRDLVATQGAEVVVLKMGGYGALVGTASGVATVPVYRSDSVWKIGSGDVFSAAFTRSWALEGRSPGEAADIASRATAHYCGTRSTSIPPGDDLAAFPFHAVEPGRGRIYVAGPFFNLAERWMIEEIRTQLLHMGADVFSPLHDVGPGPGEMVGPLDLAALDRCGAVLAVLNGVDPGTIFEVGYARAKGLPVVALAQNVRPEDLKMIVGSDCRIVDDLVSAIYHVVWSLP